MNVYAGLALALVITGGAVAAWNKGESMLEAADRRGYDRRDAEVTAAELEKSRANAAITLRRLDVQGANHDAAVQKLAAANAAARDARDAGDRLRERTAHLVDEFCATAGDPAAVARCKAADSPAGVLADVQRRLVERARVLARVADARFVAGNTCAADYDALSVKP